MTHYLLPRFALFSLTILILCLLSGLPSSSAAITGIGQIQQCIHASDPTSTNLNCTEKYVITMAVQNADSSQSQRITSTLYIPQGTTVYPRANNSSSNGPGESSGIDDEDEATGSEADSTRVVKQLKETMTITASKSRITLRYPIYYYKSVNAKPFELVKQTNDKGPFNWMYNQCKDDWYDEDASCGFFYRNPGSKNPADRIFDSQGFCCKCGTGDYIGTDDEYSRAALECSYFSIFGASSDYSIHCLRFGNLWYSLFSIGPPQMIYDIDVNITKCAQQVQIIENNSSISNSSATNSTTTEADATCVSQVYTVGPQSPTVLSSDKKVQIQDIGSYASWEGTLELSSKYLVVPDYCTLMNDNACLARIARIKSQHINESEIGRWMLVDRHLVSVNGGDCDKIGTSFSAFRNQPNSCDMPVDSCLRNQPEDFYQKDLEKERAGLVGDFFVKNFGDFDYENIRGENPKIVFHTDRYQHSELLLSFAADDIMQTIQVSSAVLSYAIIETFQTYSKNGLLKVWVNNTGDLDALFGIDVECRPNIAPVISKPVAVDARSTKLIEFSIQAESYIGAESRCELALKNALGEIIDRHQVNFTTKSFEQDRDAQSGTTDGPPTGSEIGNEKTFQSACELCPGFWDIFCFIWHGCWLGVFYIFLAVVGILVAIIILICLLKSFLVNGCCLHCFEGDPCACCCRRKYESDEELENDDVYADNYNQHNRTYYGYSD